MQTPLKVSPLAIDHHEFRSIRIESSDRDNPTGFHSLRTKRATTRSEDSPSKWMVDLTVEISNSDEDDPAPYVGQITARGWFTVAEGYPFDKQASLIEVTAASILYGACREMIANFTARASHGPLSIPSISFAPMTTPSRPAKGIGRKAVKKKVAKRKREA